MGIYPRAQESRCNRIKSERSYIVENALAIISSPPQPGQGFGRGENASTNAGAGAFMDNSKEQLAGECMVRMSEVERSATTVYYRLALTSQGVAHRKSPRRNLIRNHPYNRTYFSSHQTKSKPTNHKIPTRITLPSPHVDSLAFLEFT